ncbi:hypothetical protein L3X38_032270 [Prunus dulcis]|uniref:Uncharacterized protein n=1 Tax=Prunus dulcis TaxID=3755 RepID=A0AAD4YWG5_PRUDU|nr:hypothetical protein L3X38_032270 [Prunus dulcis]
MWDFVQVAVVVTRFLEIRIGSWELRQSGASAGVWHLRRLSSFGRGEGVSALVLVVLRLDMLGSVGAVGHSLVPQVGKLEVVLTLARGTEGCRGGLIELELGLVSAINSLQFGVELRQLHFEESPLGFEALARGLVERGWRKLAVWQEQLGRNFLGLLGSADLGIVIEQGVQSDRTVVDRFGFQQGPHLEVETSFYWLEHEARHAGVFVFETHWFGNTILAIRQGTFGTNLLVRDPWLSNKGAGARPPAKGDPC